MLSPTYFAVLHRRKRQILRRLAEPTLHQRNDFLLLDGTRQQLRAAQRTKDAGFSHYAGNLLARDTQIAQDFAGGRGGKSTAYFENLLRSI